MVGPVATLAPGRDVAERGAEVAAAVGDAGAEEVLAQLALLLLGQSGELRFARIDAGRRQASAARRRAACGPPPRVPG